MTPIPLLLPLRLLVPFLLLCSCGTDDGPIVIDLDATPSETTRTFEVDGTREITIIANDIVVVEAWIAGGSFASATTPSWIVPAAQTGERVVTIEAQGEVTLTAWSRGTVPPTPTRERSATWFDAAILDDESLVSFERVMSAIAADGHGGAMLDQWFRAFAAGPGAGRATFAQFLGEVVSTQASNPSAWDLGALPFKVTGVHNRQDLARGEDCGELRVSIASTHATLSPLHMLFIFTQVPASDDVTPDGVVHCRGTARRWARLASMSTTEMASAARAILDEGIRRERFVMTESVELTISPWQWRQWAPNANGVLVNPPLFQTVDVTRVNAPGALRDAFLAEVSANQAAILERTWSVPSIFRSAVIEVQPNLKAPLVDLTGIDVPSELPRAIGMVGCARCHTDDADFVQTNIERVPSPFYDRELDARTERIEALSRGEFPAAAPFGPLQPL